MRRTETIEAFEGCHHPITLMAMLNLRSAMPMIPPVMLLQFGALYPLMARLKIPLVVLVQQLRPQAMGLIS